MTTTAEWTPATENPAAAVEIVNAPVFVREVTAKYIGARRACFKILAAANALPLSKISTLAQ